MSGFMIVTIIGFVVIIVAVIIAAAFTSDRLQSVYASVVGVETAVLRVHDDIKKLRGQVIDQHDYSSDISEQTAFDEYVRREVAKVKLSKEQLDQWQTWTKGWDSPRVPCPPKPPIYKLDQNVEVRAIQLGLL